MRDSTQFRQPTKVPATDPGDRQLLQAVAAGNRDALAELYTSYFPRLFRFVHRLSHDYSLTEEVVNDVMLIVWQSAHQFRGTAKVSTWILGIGYRQCMKRLRKRRIPRLDSLVTQEQQATDDSSVELDEMITKALGQLTPEHRMMIECVLYLGMSYQEVAELAGCPINTAKTRVHNARKKLKLILTAMGYRYGEHLD